MAAMPPEEFSAMKGYLTKSTPKQLFETYRISRQTWCKLRDGLPVKRKTLDQVRARYRQVAGV